ncbi:MULTISPECIES: hypothetical protein [unclassified Paraburkholderia]|uniref:hypothetical protein n=1 Tax=unclassified Paraburkholderia TaxID=2615204 RepID=UPI002AB79A12|nr:MULTISPECIES: hypothetical protein [unclassified Paraburkholderia]
MKIYDLYKPFRNELRRMALQPALANIWWYQRLAAPSAQISLPIGINGSVLEFYTWELHTLCREVLLNACGSENTLSTPNGMIRMINHIRRISEGISERTVNSGDDALNALHALAHQQARWQYSRDEARLFRAYHIYSDHELAPVFRQATGISVRDMFLLAIAMTEAGARRAGTNASQDYTAFGVSNEARDRFFRMTGTTLTTIRHRLENLQRDDEGWEFTWNALEATPFINLDDNRSPGFWCPLPQLLLRRVTEGLFYDLAHGATTHRIKYGNEYGRAFERYVGRVIAEVFDVAVFSISGEQPYKGKHGEKHGVDWIVSDSTGNLFLECKTRRMKQDAKETPAGESLDKSLDELAEAVVQLYANIDDAVKGLSKWTPNGLAVYPMVVTYEDWYLLTPQVVDKLNENVRVGLEKECLPKTLVETMPYFVTSINEFEMAAQDIAYLGIRRFCASGIAKEYRHFQLSALATTEFPTEARSHDPLLTNSWAEIFPEMQEWASMSVDSGRAMSSTAGPGEETG